MRKFFLFFLIFLFFPLSSLAGQPEQCLKDIGRAINAGDAAAFEKLVDVNGILEQALDVFLAEAAKPENAKEMPPMLAVMLAQAAGQPDIRRLLLGEARSFLMNGIASGAFAGKKLDNRAQQCLLAPLFAQASIGRKEIHGIGNPVKDDDNGWFLPFNVHDYGNGNDYAVIGHLTPVDGKLKLTAIENLEQLLAQIRKEASEEDYREKAFSPNPSR